MTDTAPPPPPGSRTEDPPFPEGPPGPTGSTRPSAGPFAGTLSGRTLRRSRTDRKVAGVAGGLGRWLDVDPTVLRVLLVVLTLFGGAGLVVYVVAWLIVPEEGATQGTVPTGESVRNAVLIGALAVTALVAFGADSRDGQLFPWPLLVVGLVVAAVLLGRDRRGPGSPPPPPSTPSPPDGTEPTVVLEKPSAWSSPGGPPPRPAAPPAPLSPRRTGPLLFGPALALLALGLGILGLYDATGGSVDAAAYPALALALVGLVLVAGAFVGRPGGLILLGSVAAVALLVTSVVDPAYSGPRELRVVPTSGATLDDSYHVPAGLIELDLRDLDPADLDGRSLDVSVRAGEIEVLVPRSVQLSYTVAVDFGGHVDVDGRVDDGWSPGLSGTDGPDDAEADLDLRLSADFGELRVVRS